MRRHLVVLTVLLTFLAGPLAAHAQDATPVAATPASAAALGLPELKITLSETAYQAPQEVPAGRYLVTQTYTGSNPENNNGADFLRLPDNLSFQDFTNVLTTPEVGQGKPPAWYYQALQAGGPLGGASAVAQTIVDLEPGTWVVWAGYPGAPQPPVTMTVTGAAGATPTTGAEPPADQTVTMTEYAFGLPDTIAPGHQIWKVTNAGQQPHLMALTKVPAGTTEQQLLALISLPESATPAPGSPNPNEFVGAGGLGTLSAGKTAWAVLDLAPGTYAAICFVPDEKTGAPHAAMGMIQVFTVGS